jgi:hypothetical protein
MQLLFTQLAVPPAGAGQSLAVQHAVLGMQAPLHSLEPAAQVDSHVLFTQLVAPPTGWVQSAAVQHAPFGMQEPLQPLKPKLHRDWHIFDVHTSVAFAGAVGQFATVQHSVLEMQAPLHW